MDITDEALEARRWIKIGKFWYRDNGYLRIDPYPNKQGFIFDIKDKNGFYTSVGEVFCLDALDEFIENFGRYPRHIPFEHKKIITQI